MRNCNHILLWKMADLSLDLSGSDFNMKSNLVLEIKPLLHYYSQYAVLLFTLNVRYIVIMSDPTSIVLMNNRSPSQITCPFTKWLVIFAPLRADIWLVNCVCFVQEVSGVSLVRLGYHRFNSYQGHCDTVIVMLSLIAFLRFIVNRSLNLTTEFLMM